MPTTLLMIGQDGPTEQQLLLAELYFVVDTIVGVGNLNPFADEDVIDEFLAPLQEQYGKQLHVSVDNVQLALSLFNRGHVIYTWNNAKHKTSKVQPCGMSRWVCHAFAQALE